MKYLKRNFAPGRVFHSLEDFNAQFAAWQADVADQRIHGTTHQRPVERFAEEAKALVPVAGQGSFLQAMMRERVVADDWLVSLEGNRYSVPFGLIGKTVQVVREGGAWVIRHRARIVAEHAVLAGKALAERQPRARTGCGGTQCEDALRRAGRAADPRRGADERDVEVRDLAIYDQLLSTELTEAA